MQFLHAGFLPTHRGSVFNLSAHAEAEAQAFGASVVSPGLPRFETETLEMAKLVRDVDINDDETATAPDTSLGPP